MRVKFHQNLDDLKEKLLVMAGMAEQAIQRSIEAYRTRDRTASATLALEVRVEAAAVVKLDNRAVPGWSKTRSRSTPLESTAPIRAVVMRLPVRPVWAGR